MSAYAVDLTRRAAKALDAIDKPRRRRIMAAIDGLTSEPRPPGCTKLAGNDDLWRIRVGDYRVIYEVHGHRLLVLDVDVGHRSEIYRQL